MALSCCLVKFIVPQSRGAGLTQDTEKFDAGIFQRRDGPTPYRPFTAFKNASKRRGSSNPVCSGIDARSKHSRTWLEFPDDLEFLAEGVVIEGDQCDKAWRFWSTVRNGSCGHRDDNVAAISNGNELAW